jgi:hypothetical protein
MSPDDARTLAEIRTLAEAQAGFVAALTTRSRVAGEFDEARMHALARIIVVKRRRLVDSACPALRRTLHTAFAALFDAYAAECPSQSGDTPHDDALRFTQWLARGRALPPTLRWLRLRLGFRRVVRLVLAR